MISADGAENTTELLLRQETPMAHSDGNDERTLFMVAVFKLYSEEWIVQRSKAAYAEDNQRFAETSDDLRLKYE